MEDGDSESVNEESHMEMTIKTEVKTPATSSAHIDIEMDYNHLKQESRLVRYMKSEPALLVKEEILKDGSQAGNEQQCVQGTTIQTSTGRVNEDCGTSMRGLLNVKHESEDIDIGPTVLQHMNIHYTINKNMSAGTEENTIAVDCNKAMPCSGNKKESLEDKLRASYEQQCVQGTTTPASTVGVNEDCGTSLRGLLNVKHESEDIDIGRTVLQHMDIHYTINKNMSAGTGQSTIVDDCSKVMPCSGVKKESLEEKLRDNNDKTHMTFCWGQEKDCLHRAQHLATISNSFKHNRTTSKPHFLHNKLQQRNSRKVSMMTSIGVTTSSNQRRGETAKTKQKPDIRAKECSSKVAKLTQSGDLTKKKKVHTCEKPYQCDTCDARFARRNNIIVHMTTHMSGKSYRCDTCDARFATSRTLIKHKRTHTGEKPYQCATCDARFALKFTLVQHRRVHTGEKPYRCDTCDARFAHKFTLVQHRRVHTGEKPYRCATCDARFTQNGALIEHRRVHTGEKPYRCATCYARFAKNSNLTQHKRTHTGEKPYGCDTCDKRFAQKGNLADHMRRFHAH